MAFGLFLLVTVTLFVRPAEIIVDLASVPIYEWLILSCCLLSLPRVLNQLTGSSMRKQPITLCVLGMAAAIALSHLARLDFWSARYSSLDFGKVLTYYLLLVANVDTRARLQTFLLWLAGCIAAVVVLALLQYYTVIDIPSLAVLEELAVDDDGEAYFVPRLRSTGIFNDPNDLSMLVVFGLMIAAYHAFGESRAWLPIWLAAGGIFLWALFLTKSRGGLLALLTALIVLFQARFGWRKAILLGALLMPALVALAGSRQAGIGSALEDGTGQDRVQLWSVGLAAFRRSPLFGIGCNLYETEAGHVAHNSYVHCFTELGSFGGAIFLAAFYYAVQQLHRLQPANVFIFDRNLARLRPSLLGAIAGYAAGMMSLSRPYVTPTYLLLGLATVYLKLVKTYPILPAARIDRRFIKHVVALSVVFLAATYAFVRIAVRWS